MMKMQRPGLVLKNDGQNIKIGVNTLLSTRATKLIEADIVITVNELTSRGDIRLGIHTPTLLSVCPGQGGLLCKNYLNRLCLTRGVGTSVVIRKKNTVSDQLAMNDLRENGIYITNSTSSLIEAGHKTGASLVFYANELIWKVVRLELTLLRGVN
jgi:hypothetical protein